jgi:hypothetical protein
MSEETGTSDPVVTTTEAEPPKPGPGASILQRLAAEDRAAREAKEPKTAGVNKLAQMEELIRLAAEDNGTFQALVGRKPMPQAPKPTVEEEIHTLRSRLEAREQAEREQALKAQLQEAEGAIVTFVQEQKEQFPLLNALNMQAAVFDRLQAAYAEGREISESEAAGEIEAALVKQIEDLAQVPLVVEKVLALHGGAKPKATKTASTAQSAEGQDEVSTTVQRKKSAKSKTLTSSLNSSVPRTEEPPKSGSQSHRSKVADILKKYGSV